MHRAISVFEYVVAAFAICVAMLGVAPAPQATAAAAWSTIPMSATVSSSDGAEGASLPARTPVDGFESIPVPGLSKTVTPELFAGTMASKGYSIDAQPIIVSPEGKKSDTNATNSTTSDVAVLIEFDTPEHATASLTNGFASQFAQSRGVDLGIASSSVTYSGTAVIATYTGANATLYQAVKGTMSVIGIVGEGSDAAESILTDLGFRESKAERVVRFAVAVIIVFLLLAIVFRILRGINRRVRSGLTHQESTPDVESMLYDSSPYGTTESNLHEEYHPDADQDDPAARRREQMKREGLSPLPVVAPRNESVEFRPDPVLQEAGERLADRYDGHHDDMALSRSLGVSISDARLEKEHARRNNRPTTFYPARTSAPEYDEAGRRAQVSARSSQPLQARSSASYATASTAPAHPKDARVPPGISVPAVSATAQREPVQRETVQRETVRETPRREQVRETVRRDPRRETHASAFVSTKASPAVRSAAASVATAPAHYTLAQTPVVAATDDRGAQSVVRRSASSPRATAPLMMTPLMSGASDAAPLMHIPRGALAPRAAGADVAATVEPAAAKTASATMAPKTTAPTMAKPAADTTMSPVASQEYGAASELAAHTAPVHSAAAAHVAEHHVAEHHTDARHTAASATPAVPESSATESSATESSAPESVGSTPASASVRATAPAPSEPIVEGMAPASAEPSYAPSAAPVRTGYSEVPVASEPANPYRASRRGTGYSAEFSAASHSSSVPHTAFGYGAGSLTGPSSSFGRHRPSMQAPVVSRPTSSGRYAATVAPHSPEALADDPLFGTQPGQVFVPPSLRGSVQSADAEASAASESDGLVPVRFGDDETPQAPTEPQDSDNQGEHAVEEAKRRSLKKNLHRLKGVYFPGAR